MPAFAAAGSRAYTFVIPVATTRSRVQESAERGGRQVLPLERLAEPDRRVAQRFDPRPGPSRTSAAGRFGCRCSRRRHGRDGRARWSRAPPGYDSSSVDCSTEPENLVFGCFAAELSSLGGIERPLCRRLPAIRLCAILPLVVRAVNRPAARRAGSRYGSGIVSPSGDAHPWPIKPFDRQHPVRGLFGDPRIGDGGGKSFHFGVDVTPSTAPPSTPSRAAVSRSTGRTSP